MELVKNPDQKTAKDIYAEVTDKMIEMLEAGVLPWRPVHHHAGYETPRNPFTRRPYSGINVLVLLMETLRHGFTTHRWGTKNQIYKAGGVLKLRAFTTEIVFYRPIPIEGSKDYAYVAKKFEVYNLDHTRGLEKYIAQGTAPVFKKSEGVEKVETFLNNCKAKVVVSERHSNPAYHMLTDFITMPTQAQFKSLESYYAALAHEHIHWTGSQKRLKRFSDEWETETAYAAEELIAELGSVFLATEHGMPLNLANHASYLDHWLSILRKDKRAIFRAAAKASAATKYLKGLQPKKKSKAKLKVV